MLFRDTRGFISHLLGGFSPLLTLGITSFSELPCSSQVILQWWASKLFSVKGQIANIFSSPAHIVSVTTILSLWRESGHTQCVSE